MASYKVPQDVEADDKLIGPFSFRQFIYLIIVALAIALAWGLAQIFIGLAIIPLPIILLFGALALPLRKDQPMEIYLAAMISFLLKPRMRMWDPDGVDSNIEISAPKTVDINRKKDLSEGEAHERLNYLANLVDTQGWSIRGVQSTNNIAMNTDVLLEAQGAEDILDTNTSVANTFGQMMQESTRRMHEEAKQRMMNITATPEPVAQPQPVMQPQPVAQPIYTQPQPMPVQPAYQPVVEQPELVAQAVQAVQPQPIIQPPQTVQIEEVPVFNPYPNIQQSVIQPLDATDRVAEAPQPQPTQETTSALKSTPPKEPEPITPPSTSEKQASAGIIELANSSDLSIQTIARQANRLNSKSDESDEVVISLR